VKADEGTRKKALRPETLKEGTKMKSLTMNLMFAAAALVVVSSAASSAAMAADVVKFEVPFAFQAGGKTMAPGTYTFRPSNDDAYFLVSNVRSGEKVFVSALGAHDPEKEWKAQDGGILQLEFGDGYCGLKQLWTGQGHSAIYLSKPGGNEGKSTHLALIRSVNSK
jgi:hypothetical protein